MTKQQLIDYIVKIKAVIALMECAIADGTDGFYGEWVCSMCGATKLTHRMSCECGNLSFNISESRKRNTVNHFNDTNGTIHAGQSVNICNCCGNIKKPTTKADNGEYYCNICINDISGNIHDVRRFCAICGIKLQGFYDVNSPDDLKCQGCESFHKIGGGSDE